MLRRSFHAIARQTAKAAIAGFLAAYAVAAQARVDCCTHNSCPNASYQTNRVALVVGVDKYSGDTQAAAADGLINLKNSVKDAKDIAELLEPFYSVRCVLNPTAAEFRDELKLLAAYLAVLNTGPEENLFGNSVLLHFSGHGSRMADEDYIFLSGNYTTVEDAKNNGAIPINYISDLFQSFNKLEKTFIFDACRNYLNSNIPIKPSWLQAGFGKPEDHRRDWQAVVYSTESGRFAYDRNDLIGTNDNGAFVFSLKKYLKFGGLELQKAIQILRTDPMMVRIGQKPDFYSPDLFGDVPWTGKPADACRTFEAAAVHEAGSCRRFSSDVANCMSRAKACEHVNQMEALHLQNCSSVYLRSVFPELTCAPPRPDAPVAQVFGITRVSSQTNELIELRRQALLTSAQQKFEQTAAAAPLPDRRPASIKETAGVAELVGRLETIARVEGRTSAPQKQVVPIRTKILLQGRQVSDRTFNQRASAHFEVPPGRIELYNVPGAAGGTTGQIKPAGPPKVDCETQYCDPNWVMVRVPVGKAIIDGWLPSSQIAIRQLNAKIEVSYNERELIPALKSREPLRAFIENARLFPRAIVAIVAIIPSPASDELRIQARARVARLKMILDERAASPERISSQIIEAEVAGVTESMTVGLLNP